MRNEVSKRLEGVVGKSGEPLSPFNTNSSETEPRREKQHIAVISNVVSFFFKHCSTLCIVLYSNNVASAFVIRFRKLVDSFHLAMICNMNFAL